MATQIVRVPEAIAKASLTTVGGRWQEENYGPSKRVCNSAGSATQPKWRETTTGQDFAAK